MPLYGASGSPATGYAGVSHVQTEEMPSQAAFGPIVSDDLLFDGEPMSAQFGILAQDLDLFDDMPSHRSAWSAAQDMSRVA